MIIDPRGDRPDHLPLVVARLAVTQRQAPPGTDVTVLAFRAQGDVRTFVCPECGDEFDRATRRLDGQRITRPRRCYDCQRARERRAYQAMLADRRAYRAGVRAVEAEQPGRACVVCDGPMPRSVRADRLYCSGRCRMRALRGRGLEGVG